jgi:hypothetical protein
MARGVRYRLRQFTATAVKEHIRAQIEDTGGSPELTKNEIEWRASFATIGSTGIATWPTTGGRRRERLI